MKERPFRAQLADYILSGHAYLHVPTSERTRFLDVLNELAATLTDEGRQVYVWSQATGWSDGAGNSISAGAEDSAAAPSQPDPQRVGQEILELPEESTFVLRDFGYYLDHKVFSYADVVIAWLTEIRDVLAGTGRTVIFLGPELNVPKPLETEVTTLDFPLPDSPAIEGSIRSLVQGHTWDESNLPELVAACRGMTAQQIEDRTALALRRFKTLNSEAARLIRREKAEIIRRTGLLKFMEPPDGGLSLIGGNDAVKQHVLRDRACFGDDARKFGIDPPRGLMLTGISGCGKTAISLSAASELRIPLIQLDVGALMSKWVGESEANVRSALQQVEAMAPCVLQIDEVEKGFGSVGSDGDGGASMRAFGTLLKWMSERTCSVYVMMTANDVKRLPPEFTRKGRIDEIFGVYLPVEAERREILSIHLRLKKREPDNFDLDKLADATDSYSGADIEQVINVGLKLAFHAGKELTTKWLLAAVPQVRPLSATDPQRVSAMTEWLDRHTVSASSLRAVESSNGGSARKPRRVAV